MRGFTLLEVMVALAIMAAVILTVLASVNYHLEIISGERDSTAMTILARARLTELEQTSLPDRSEGTLAPAHPELTWRAEVSSTQLTGLRKLVLKLRRPSDGREVTLVRYILK